jgi:hypothetical protein
MNEKEFRSWEEQRKKGRTSFVAVTGVLSYGVPMSIVMTFFVGRLDESGLSPTDLVIQVAIWLFAGALFGVTMWHVQERRYARAFDARGRE